MLKIFFEKFFRTIQYLHTYFGRDIKTPVKVCKTVKINEYSDEKEPSEQLLLLKAQDLTHQDLIKPNQ